MGVVPPLVLSVQDWLAKAGIRTGETLFDMKQLVGHLKSGG